MVMTMTMTSELFDNLLQSDLREPQPGFGAATKVLKTGYSKLVSHKNLTTYSTQELFHTCPRKFAIKKLQAATNTEERINSPTFAFGHAVGAGVAVYDATQNLRSAIWEAFIAWDLDLLEAERKPGKRAGKSFWEAVWALYAYEQFYNESGLDDYESVKIEGTIAIDFEDGHFYSGHIDEVLRHRSTGRYLVKENKTSGFNNIDPALYSNSDQALSYAVVIDMLGGNEYDVLYTIYSVPEQRWISFNFVKQGFKKAEWLQDQLFLHQQIEGYQEVNFFPKRGRSCMNFMRRCEFYESCDLSHKHTYGMTFDDLPAIESLTDIQAIEHIDFATTMTEIVNRQKEKLNEQH
jgi:hypothetical protein